VITAQATHTTTAHAVVIPLKVMREWYRNMRGEGTREMG
jgi:hypothetical protein